MTKNRVSCDAEHVDMRDEGGLRCPSRITAILTGMIIFFERFLDCEDWMNECFLSCFSSRVAFLALKGMAHKMMPISPVFSVWKGNCKSCRSSTLTHAINPLVTTYFNVTAKKFILVLNRWKRRKF